MKYFLPMKLLFSLFSFTVILSLHSSGQASVGAHSPRKPISHLTRLIQAAQRNKPQDVQKILSAKDRWGNPIVDIDQADCDPVRYHESGKWTALMAAAKAGHGNIMHTLLLRGAHLTDEQARQLNLDKRRILLQIAAEEMCFGIVLELLLCETQLISEQLAQLTPKAQQFVIKAQATANKIRTETLQPIERPPKRPLFKSPITPTMAYR